MEKKKKRKIDTNKWMKDVRQSLGLTNEPIKKESEQLGKELKKEKPIETFNPLKDLVLDSDMAVTEKHFATGVLRYELHGKTHEEYYYGVIIPKWEVKKDKKGNVIRTYQKLTPHIITNDFEIYEINDKFCDKHNITFTEPSHEFKYRWNLDRIKEYLDYQNTALRGDYKPPSIKKTYDRIVDLYKKYCFFDCEEKYYLHALWDIGTYFFTLFDTYPYMNFWGMRGCGKTRAMKVSSLITFNGKLVHDPSPSTLFRLVSKAKCTLYIDEAEKLFRKVGKVEVDDDRVEILNSGYTSDGSVPRQKKLADGSYITEEFSTFSPKQLGSIKGIKGALQDRCINNVMTRPSNGVKYDDEPNLVYDKEFLEIRNDLYEIGLHYRDEVHTEYVIDKIDKLSGVANLPFTNRVKQIWKPIFTILHVILSDYKQKGVVSGEGVAKKDIRGDLIKFAIKCGELNAMEDFHEGSYEECILNNFIALSKQKGELPIYVKEIQRMCIEDGINVSCRYVAQVVDKMGFDKYKCRRNSGMCYLVAYKKINSILGHLKISTLTTLTTQTHLLTDDKTPIIISEEEVKE